ncbi:MAG: hypothetical protein NC453_23995 [Muribaculum sp.]|nr:hypothetical protein [Muribaculum sp.]
MTTYDLIKVNQGLIAFLDKNGITAGDLANLAIYEDYLDMRQQEEDVKVSWVITQLAEKYKCSERHIYKVVKRMAKDL